MLKCPYCIKTRPSRSRLQIHVDNVHRHADVPAVRKAAVASARQIIDVVPDLNVPTPTRLSAVGTGLEQAGQEIRDLKAAADAVLARLEALDAAVMAPAAVRSAALNQAWDRMLAEGSMSGARIMQRMINESVEGDRS